jgi:hypothetical protein
LSLPSLTLSIIRVRNWLARCQYNVNEWDAVSRCQRHCISVRRHYKSEDSPLPLDQSQVGPLPAARWLKYRCCAVNQQQTNHTDHMNGKFIECHCIYRLNNYNGIINGFLPYPSM